MSILAFGGEMGFFIPSDSEVKEGTTAYSEYWDSSFTRCAMIVPRSSGYAETPTVTTTANFWLHFEFDNAAGGSVGTICTLYDSGGVGRVRVRTDGASAGTLYLDTYNGAAWGNAGNITIATNARQTIDIHVVSNTASGSADLYVAGTQRITSGTLDLSGFTGVSKVRFTGRSSSFTEMGVSQVVMASETTIGMRVSTLYMTGQGATHTFDTGGFGAIDETIYSDADFNQSGTAAQIETYTGTSVASFTGYTIRALALTARAKTDGTAPTKMRFILRSAGTNYDNGADITLGFGYGGYCAVWETNPATSAAFLSSEISALNFGVKSIT